MMIFFNDPVIVPNPAERALRMAMAMRDRVGEISNGWRKHGHDFHSVSALPRAMPRSAPSASKAVALDGSWRPVYEDGQARSRARPGWAHFMNLKTLRVLL